jgi:hypothetical protein
MQSVNFDSTDLQESIEYLIKIAKSA